MASSFSSLHVLANVIRTILLFALLFAIVFGLVLAGATLFEAWRLPNGTLGEWLDRGMLTLEWMAPYVAGGCLAWIALALMFSGMMIHRSSGCRVVTPGSQPRLEQILKRLCDKAGMDVPRLGIIDSSELNAFASGLFKSDYTVAVTRGLMARLDDAELEAVMAHELAHIRHRDVFLSIVAATVAGGFALIAELMFFGISRTLYFVLGANDEGDNVLAGWIAFVIGFVLVLFAAVISTLTGFAISRSREYLADAGAAELTGRPDALISALEKIKEDCDIGAPAGVMQMCIDRPRPLLGLLSTHPDTDDRISALRDVPVVAPRPQAVAPRMRAHPSMPAMQVRASFGRR